MEDQCKCRFDKKSGMSGESFQKELNSHIGKQRKNPGKMRRQAIVVLACCLAFLFTISAVIPAKAATRYVPDSYTTIQQAINASSTGDEIIVRSGTYPENINFHGKAIVVRSLNGPEATIIDGGGTATVVTFSLGEGPASVLDGFTITNGDADSGGGIFIYYASPTINNCIITGNRVGWNDPIMRYGGGVAIENGSPAINNCIITGNWASGYGGGVSCRGASAAPVFTDCLITKNTADTFDGGGLYFSLQSSLVVQHCTITNNIAGYNGGGISSDAYSDSSLTITDSTITNNTAVRRGGAINCEDATAAITNSIMAGNGAENYGGGLYFKGATASITNSTITGNEVSVYGGGGVFAFNASLTVVNSLLWGDTYGGAPNEIASDSSPNGTTSIDITFSDVEGGWTGNGNINCDPELLAATNYHLQSSSCAVDAGTNGGTVPALDFEGDSRPQGSGVDIGADEYTAHAGFITLDRWVYPRDSSIGVVVMDSDLNTDPAVAEQYNNLVSITTTGGDQETNIMLTEIGTDSGAFSASLATSAGAIVPGDGIVQINPQIADRITATYQDADDGTGNPATDIDEAATDFALPVISNVVLADLGQCSATVSWDTDELTSGTVLYGTGQTPDVQISELSFVSDFSLALSGLASATTYKFAVESEDLAGNTTIDDNGGQYYTFTTSPSVVYYVPDDFSTIQAAIDAIPSCGGNEIVVRSGTYPENINFHGKPIVVRSESGPETTIIDGGNAASVVTFNSFEGPDSVLDGFTVTNGNAAYGGGIITASTSPTITNCIISNNTATASGGGIYCASSPSSPTITNCIITDNSAENGGGVYFGYALPTITNSVISNNSATVYGGGLYVRPNNPLATVVNSIIWGNSAGSYYDEMYLGNYLDVSFSDIGGGTSGIGNMDADPRFVDPAAGDYHLSVDSPCIDTGTDDLSNYPTLPSTDIEGDTRPQGYGYDMGPDEFVCPEPDCSSIDSDGDGMPNVWENLYGLDPYDSGDAGLDNDGDGLVNLIEFNYATDPVNPDTDGDGVDDGHDGIPNDPNENVCPVIVQNYTNGAPYGSIAAAYSDQSTNNLDVIQVTAADQQQYLVFDRDIVITIAGGYFCDFELNPVETVIDGSITITKGTVIIEKIVVR